MFETPILFLIFNRIDTAQKVFERIKEKKPKYLYIAADGPRRNKEGEAEACKKTRESILNQIDWDCELKTLFRDKNLGCKKAVSGAISWFFENVEQGIILEDDCLPDPSFFGFCEVLLKKYKNDNRIMMISGDCFLPNNIENNATYMFSRYAHIWGWATWKRAWGLYDINMNTLTNFINNDYIKSISSNFFFRKVTLYNLKQVKNKKIDTRDYQRGYSIRINHGLCIFPGVNLIRNIGFSCNALHTKNDFGLGNLKTSEIYYKNLIHPKIMAVNDKYMNYDEYNIQLCFKQYIAIFLKKIKLFNFISKMLGYS